ncbi:hypothetical protein [Thiomicrospira sp. WB1]|nr:hypothetical protein [Thiomicrospira sp. WB1]
MESGIDYVLAATGFSMAIIGLQLWWPWRCARRLRQRLEASQCD